MMAFLGLPGHTEWIIILIIALLIFGKRLPEVMRSMGQSIKQFKKGMEDEIEIDPETADKNEESPQEEDDEEKSATG